MEVYSWQVFQDGIRHFGRSYYLTNTDYLADIVSLVLQDVVGNHQIVQTGKKGIKVTLSTEEVDQSPAGKNHWSEVWDWTGDKLEPK